MSSDSSIPPAKRVKLDQSREACPLSLSSSSLIPSSVSPFAAISSPTCIITRYAEYLKALYATSSLAEPDKFAPCLGLTYVKLALVTRERVTGRKTDKFTCLTFETDFVDRILSIKEEIKMDNILKGENTRLVVVEGAPGIGKSTLAWELCRQWPTMESLQRFSLVVLLKLREKEVQSAKSISDLFPWEDDLEKSRLVAEKVKEENGKGVLFVFDGFDEFPADLRKTSPVVKVIKGTFLPRSTIVLTSRPSATADLQPFLNSLYTKHIEVVGFAETDIQSCAEHVFGAGSDILASFSAYLSANPVVKGMMYNPLNCAIILEVYQATAESGRPIPHTQTQLYTEMTLWRLSRYLSETGNSLATNLPSRLEDLPHDSDLYQQLVKVGELAYNGGVKARVIFENLPEGCEDLGLLVKHAALYRRNKTSTYNFFHLTMQEYMSAFYISQLPVDQQRTLLVKHEISNVVWKFVAGLTKMKYVGWDVLPVNRRPTWWSCGDNVVDELLVQCLYESQDVQCLESKFGLGVVKFENRQSISNYGAFALGYCISKTCNFWEITVSRSRAFDFEYVMLGCGLKYVASGGIINKLTYSFDKTNKKEEIHTPIHHIKSLEFSYCGIDQKGFRNLTEYLPYLQNLISLELCDDELEPGVAILLEELRGHKKLESLGLWGMDTNVDDANALMALVESSQCCLRELYVSLITVYERPDLPQESYRKLGRSLLSSRSSLETLYIKSPLTALDNVDDIAENISILHLDLPLERTDPNLHPSGITYGTKLSQILRMNTSLKKLCVDMTLDKNEVCDILYSLEDNHTLEKLEIIENDCLSKALTQSNSYTPDSNSHTPDSDSHIPNLDSHIPDSDSHTPDSDSHTTLDSDSHTPDSDSHTTLDLDSHTPDFDSHTPDSDSHTPDSDSHTPDSDSHTTLDSDSRTPDSDSRTLDLDSHTPDSDSHTPDSDSHTTLDSEELELVEHEYFDSDLNSEPELDSAQSKDSPYTPEELELVENDSLGTVEPMTESASEPLPAANPSEVKDGTKFSNFLRRNTSLKELTLFVSLERDELHDIVQSLRDNHTLEKLKLSKEFKSEYSSMNIEDPRISWIDRP